MKKIKFYKETDNRWYVDLPEYPGPKGDLEMVCGADTMLEYMAEGNNKIELNVSEDEFENSDEIIFVDNAEGNGANYKINKYKGIEINLDVWLCNVTVHVFGYFPKKIYVNKIGV